MTLSLRILDITQRISKSEDKKVVNQITLAGMVLSATPVGEYDKRLVILTKERGKITAFAKGARKPNSPFVAGSRPMSFGSFTVYEGRNSYGVTAMNISNYFEELAIDIDKVYYGFYMLEMADYYARENVEATSMLNLLYISLKALINNRVPYKLVRRIFELKMMMLNGEYPELFTCVKCQEGEALASFSIDNNGMICKKCLATNNGKGTDSHNKTSTDIEIRPSTLYTLQYIVTSDLDKLYTFVVTDEVMAEINMVVKRFIKKHIDKEFKSEELLI